MLGCRSLMLQTYTRTLTPLAIVQNRVLAVFRRFMSLAAAQAFCDTRGGNYDKMSRMAHVPDRDGPCYLSV
jgi:hypothetical protein